MPAPRNDRKREKLATVLTLVVVAIWLAGQKACAHDGSARHNKADEQIAKITEHLKDEPEDADAIRERAYLYATVNEEYESGLADFDRLLQLKPKSQVARANRGLERSKTGDWKGAAADLDAVCSASTTVPVAWFARAELRRNVGDLAGARTDIDRALELHQWGAAYVLSAEVHEARGDLAGALGDYDKALGKDPRHLDALAGRATVYASQGKYAEATRDIDTALEIAKEDARPHAARARCFQKQGFQDAAKREADIAVSAYQKEAKQSRSQHRAAESLLYAARLVLDATKDAKGALALLDDALSLAPDRIDLLREKVRILDSLGQKDAPSDTVRKKLADVESSRLP